MKEEENKNDTGNKYISKFKSGIATVLDKIIPPFAPLINLEEKLVPGEKDLDHAIVRHFVEIQILIGILGTIAGFILMFQNLYFIFLFIASILLVLTGFEIEEIYVTTQRLMVRRIGLFERIIRIPSDEEHLIQHLVSYRIGRAPFNLPLIGVSLLSLFSLFSQELSLTANFVLFLSGAIIFIYALRLGRRNITLEFAGGHQVLLGLRKGIPYHIIRTLMKVVYGKELDADKDLKEDTKAKDEKPGKAMDISSD